MPKPKFFSGTKNASSWAMRAWLALREAGVDFEEEIVDIRRPQRFANLAAIGRFAPPASVPVLVVDGVAIFDSLAIMEYANERCGGGLLPTDPLRRAAARSIAAWQHAGLSQIAGRVPFESAFYPDRRPLTAGEVDDCARLMSHLERVLEANGGPFLFGTRSLADLALVPMTLKLERHDFAWSDWPLCVEWKAELLSLPSVTGWVAEADPLPPIWYDIYLPVPEQTPSAATAWTTRP